MYVGWDWASASHDITVVDESGEIVDHWAFSHSEIALQRILGVIWACWHNDSAYDPTRHRAAVQPAIA